MELSDSVAADLATLSAALDEPDADLALLVQQLGESCALAVTSYLGYSITLVTGGAPVSFSVHEEYLDSSEILTSVMFPLTAAGDSPRSQVILYAGTPGAFVDLAADLTFALKAGPEAVQLDQHLPPASSAPGDATGLTSRSRRDKALGILLDRGLDLDEGLTELQRQAERDGISLDAAAQQLIDVSVRPLLE